MMNKRERIIEILSRVYQKYDGEYNVTAFRTSHRYRDYYFDEIKSIGAEDLDKVIEMYETRSNGNWNMNDRLLLLECLYNVIKDNSNYSLICNKLLDVYKIELDNSLMYNVQRYDDFNIVETDEIGKKSYSSKIDESMILIDMCLKNIERSQRASANNTVSLEQIKKSVSIYDSVKSDFDKSNQPISPQIDNYVNSIKGKISSLEEDNKIVEETENQKREIELINLQQEINKMENEQLEIKKRITEIRMQTIGHIFSKHMSEQYPNEFAEIQKFSEQLSDISSKSSQRIIDLRKRFDKVSSDLELYRNALPVYENYYQRYNEYHQERKARKNTNEQTHNHIIADDNAEVVDNNKMNVTFDSVESKNKYISEIINSLESTEREFMPRDIENRLNSMSLSELQKLSASKSERDEKLIPPAQRNRLIGTALIKTVGYDKFSTNEKQHMINQLQSYTNEQLLNYIANQALNKSNSVKEENIEMKSSANNISEYLDDLYIKDDKVVNFINSNYSQYGKVDKLLSVHGYPDSIYEVRFDNGQTHEITVPHEVKFGSPSTIFGNESYKKDKNTQDINNEQVLNNGNNSIQNHSIDIETIVRQINEINPDITSICANGTFEYNGQYRLKVRDWTARNTSIEISKDLYDKLNEYFKNNPQDISTHIAKSKNSNNNDMNVNSIEQPENSQEKNQIIKDIIKLMLDAGEFSNSGLDINTKTQDVQYIKNRLEGMPIENLRTILSEYSKNADNNMENQEEYTGKKR